MTALQQTTAPATRPGNTGKRARRSWLLRPDARTGLLFVLPCVVLFVAFRFGPAIAGTLFSFTDYTVGADPVWSGLKNFNRLFDDPTFWQALRVTAIYTALAVPLSVIASLAMALLTRRATRTTKFYRSVFFLPVVTSLVLASVVFAWIFSADGPIAKLTGGTSWLADSFWVIPALVIVSVWSRFGYGMMILLARLQDMPTELEEAASTDGANSWQRFRAVTFPHLRPALFFVAIIETTVSFQAFDIVYVMTGGGPVRSSYTLVYALFDQGFRYFDLGYASAIGVALFVMTLVVAVIQRLTLGRES